MRSDIETTRCAGTDDEGHPRQLADRTERVALPDGVAAEDADPLDMVLPWTIRCAVAQGAGVQSVLDTLEQSR